jgi:tetratricopeptide (TPR) repeat protein
VNITTEGGDYAEHSIDKRTTVTGNQTNIAGDVHGNVYSGTFQGPVSFTTPQPRDRLPAFQVPYPRNPLFVGRQAELAQLDRLLTSATPVAIAPALLGMGGVGKTQLAVEFAHTRREQFPGGVFWLSMAQPSLIEGQLADCAGPGGLDLPGFETLSFAERMACVQRFWAQPTPARLVICDNLEDAAVWQQWRGALGSSRVLITTRRATLSGGVQCINLPMLPRPESLDLLLRSRADERATTVAALLQREAERTAANAICTAVGDLPLALAIAGAYLKLNPTMPLARYAERLTADPLAEEQRGGALLADALTEAGLPTGRSHGVIASLRLSYDLLNPNDATDAMAVALLHAAAWGALAPIPDQVLWRVLDLDAKDDTQHEQGVAALRRVQAVGLASVATEEAQQLLSLHRVVVAFLRPERDGQRAAWCGALIDAAHDAVNDQQLGACRALLPHLEQADIQELWSDAVGQASLLLALGRVQQALLNYATALLLYERALAIREQVLGPEHPDTARSLNNLALLHDTLGNYAAAQPLYERALAIFEQMLGLTHPDIARILNNVALLHHTIGNYTTAQPLYERALAIYEQALGPEHPDTATSLNNLATLHYATGNYAAAQPLLERALAISEQALGLEHPHTALSLNNLAGLHNDMGDFTAALPLLERALAIWEQVLGPDHPSTATSLCNLAVLHYATGNHAAALTLYERALVIREQVLGPDHPDTAVSLNNLALFYYNTGNYVAAQPLYERALAIREQALGPHHLDTAISLNNLAASYYALGTFTAAQPLYERVLAIREQILGLVHPSTAQSLSNLAALYYATGNSAAAEPLYERALAIREQVLGPDHPDTAQSLNNLALLYHTTGNSAAAEPLYARALAIFTRALGAEHPSTQTVQRNLAALRAAMGEA